MKKTLKMVTVNDFYPLSAPVSFMEGPSARLPYYPPSLPRARRRTRNGSRRQIVGDIMAADETPGEIMDAEENRYLHSRMTCRHVDLVGGTTVCHGSPASPHFPALALVHGNCRHLLHRRQPERGRFCLRVRDRVWRRLLSVPG